MAKILIVEDEVKIAQLLADYLMQSQFSCLQVHDGETVVELVKQGNFDLVLLDLMLPNKDGISICKDIRQFSQLPIIMLTARVEEIDRLIGLELGADDYICKPFSPREVVARVKTVLKRSLPMSTTENKSDSKTVELDSQSHNAKIYGNDVALTAIEFNLLQILAKEPGRIYSRTQLIELAYQDHRVVSERTIDSHIKKLRKKLHGINPKNDIVQSVYSVGYRLQV